MKKNDTMRNAQGILAKGLLKPVGLALLVAAGASGCGTLTQPDAHGGKDASAPDRASPPPYGGERQGPVVKTLHDEPLRPVSSAPTTPPRATSQPPASPPSVAEPKSPARSGAAPERDRIYQADGVLLPGGYVVLAAPENSVVSYHNRAVRVDDLGQVLLGFGRDAEQVSVSVKLPNGKRKNLMFPLGFRDYEIQHVNGLKKKYVSPDAKTLRKIRADGAKARAAREHYLRSVKGWLERPFVWPASGVISGVYGSQRVLNGKPRRPHYGVDIAAPAGTPVYAPASGKITLDENMVLSGKTVMIDHGYGLRSTFMHLRKVDIKPGQVVKKGQKIGEVGQTGRATGPHLHWGMSWYEIRLDPALFVQGRPLRKGVYVRAKSTAAAADGKK